MTRHFVLAIAVLAAAGLAGPSLADDHMRVAHTAPFCSGGNNVDYTSRMDTLSTQLQLFTKLKSTINVSGGCIVVTTIENGQATMWFYEPDSLKLIATLP